MYFKSKDFFDQFLEKREMESKKVGIFWLVRRFSFCVSEAK